MLLTQIIQRHATNDMHIRFANVTGV